MREAHRPQITDLFKKYHSRLSDNAHKFKGTVVLEWKYNVHHQLEKEKHVRDVSWPVHEVCTEKLPALGVLSQDGL